MPEICRFLGIVIRMYYHDHAPAHFHADYGNYSVRVYLESEVVEGTFPRRALSSVLEWYLLHRDELWEDWRLAAKRSPLRSIAPLE